MRWSSNSKAQEQQATTPAAAAAAAAPPPPGYDQVIAQDQQTAGASSSASRMEMSQVGQQQGQQNGSFPAEKASQQQAAHQNRAMAPGNAISNAPQQQQPVGASATNPIPVAWDPNYAMDPRFMATPMNMHMYWYRNAAGQTFSTPYPPDHPYMQCLMSPVGHVPRTYHGCLGLVMGCLFFPLGCIWTAMDFQTRCKRCGQVLDSGCYSQ